MSSRRPLIVALGILPLLIDWFYKAILHPRPFWAFYFDPEMIYVQEGLRLLSGQAPHNIHNPGVPVHLLTAAIELFAGRSPQSVDAIRLCGYVIGLLLAIGAAILLERTLFRETHPLLAIAGLWTFFMAPAALLYDTIWSPEILFFPLGALVLAALSTRRPPLLAGLCSGLCIATKFVFLAWVPALLLAQRRVRSASIAACAVVLGFVAATLPVAARYRDMAHWLWGLASRSGWYGRGPAEPPHLRLTLIGYWELALDCKPWLLWCAIVSGLLVLARRRDRALIAFGSAAIVASILMAMRTPAGRYLLPGALGVVALAGAIREIHPRVVIAAFAIALAVIGIVVVDDLHTHDRLIAEQSAWRAGIDRAVARIRKPGDVVVFGWRVPEPSFALRFLAFRSDWLAGTEGHFDLNERRFDLPAGAERWDILVIERELLPDAVTPAAPDVGPFAIVRPRSR